LICCVVTVLFFLEFLWISFDFVFAAHMCSAHIVIANCSAQNVMHYVCICCCNFFFLLLRFLADSCKMFELFTVITFASLYSLKLRLIELAHALFLLYLWLLLTVLLNCVKIYRVISSENITSFLHLWCVVSCTLHSLFSLMTVDVDEDINHILKLFRLIHSDYLIFDSFVEFSIVLQY